MERLGLLAETAREFLPARRNEGMPRGNNLPYGVDDKVIRMERTRREYEAALRLLEEYREVARRTIDELHPSPQQRGFLLSFYVDGYTMKECYINLRIAERTVWRYRAMVENN